MRAVRQRKKRQYGGPVIVCGGILPLLSTNPRLNLRSSARKKSLAGVRHLAELVACHCQRTATYLAWWKSTTHTIGSKAVVGAGDVDFMSQNLGG